MDGSGHGGGMDGPVDADLAALARVLGPDAGAPLPKAPGHHASSCRTAPSPVSSPPRRLRDHPRRAHHRLRPRRDRDLHRRPPQRPRPLRRQRQGHDAHRRQGLRHHGGDRALARRAPAAAPPLRRRRGRRPRSPPAASTCRPRPPAPTPPGPLAWAPALDLATGAAGLVPFDAVDTCWLAAGRARLSSPRPTASPRAPTRSRRRSTASANSSSTTPRPLRAPAARGPRRPPPRLATVADPEAAGLLARLAGQGFATALWETTSDVGIPAFACALVDAATCAPPPASAPAATPTPASPPPAPSPRRPRPGSSP